MSTINQIASSTYRDTHKGLSNLQLQTREANKKAAADLQNQFLVNTPLFLHFLLQKYNGAVEYYLYTITYKSRLTPKKWHKKTDAIFSIYGKNGIIPWHFFLNSQLGL